MPRTQTTPPVPPVPDERWTVVQTASHLSISYQTARNNMLAGDFGVSHYDAETRTLTVLASRVRSAKRKRKQHTKKKHAKNTP